MKRDLNISEAISAKVLEKYLFSVTDVIISLICFCMKWCKMLAKKKLYLEDKLKIKRQEDRMLIKNKYLHDLKEMK